MPNKCGLSNKNCRRIRFGVASLISLVLASVMLWGLVTNYQPEAKLTKFNLKEAGVNFTQAYIELDLTNRNRFRGFNYTYGWLELYYLTDSVESSGTTDAWDYIPDDIQGFRKTLHWNFTLNITEGDFWGIYTPALKTNDAKIYASLFMAYSYKILFWSTRTTYYQFLNLNVSFTDSFTLKEATDFTRTKDFTWALSD